MHSAITSFGPAIQSRRNPARKNTFDILSCKIGNKKLINIYIYIEVGVVCVGCSTLSSASFGMNNPKAAKIIAIIGTTKLRTA